MCNSTDRTSANSPETISLLNQKLAQFTGCQGTVISHMEEEVKVLF